MTPAEAIVIVEAFRVADSLTGAAPQSAIHDLAVAVAQLREERETAGQNEFWPAMVAIDGTERAFNTLQRSRYTAHDLMYTMTAADVMDVNNTGPHTWAIWYLTCETVGVEPPWATGFPIKQRDAFHAAIRNLRRKAGDR